MRLNTQRATALFIVLLLAVLEEEDRLERRLLLRAWTWYLKTCYPNAWGGHYLQYHCLQHHSHSPRYYPY